MLLGAQYATVAWIIFVCAKGYGGEINPVYEINVHSIICIIIGKVNDLLSSKIFVPLVNMSFSGFLVYNNVKVFLRGDKEDLYRM